MSAVTATEARKRLFALIQMVNDDHAPVEVVSRHGNAVILSKEDYDAMAETAHLLRNPANAERLLAAIEREYYVTDERIVILQVRGHY